MVSIRANSPRVTWAPSASGDWAVAASSTPMVRTVWMAVLALTAAAGTAKTGIRMQTASRRAKNRFFMFAFLLIVRSAWGGAPGGHS